MQTIIYQMNMVGWVNVENCMEWKQNGSDGYTIFTSDAIPSITRGFSVWSNMRSWTWMFIGDCNLPRKHAGQISSANIIEVWPQWLGPVT